MAEEKLPEGDEAAEKTFRRAIQVFEDAGKTKRLAYLHCANYLALILIERDAEFAYAETLFRQVLAQAAHRFGEDTGHTSDLEVNIARTLMGQDKLEDAEALFVSAEKKAQTVVGRPRTVSLDYVYWWQSRLYYRQEQLAEFMSAIQKMADLWPDDADELYLAAAEFAAGLRLVSGDAAEAVGQREMITRRALEMLQKAVAQGYRDAEAISKDKAWDPLRESPEFQELLNKMARED